jgi:hypothetical protein
MNWARTANRLRKAAQELREHGFSVAEPADFDTPPERRIAST